MNVLVLFYLPDNFAGLFYYTFLFSFFSGSTHVYTNEYEKSLYIYHHSPIIFTLLKAPLDIIMYFFRKKKIESTKGKTHTNFVVCLFCVFLFFFMNGV